MGPVFPVSIPAGNTVLNFTTAILRFVFLFVPLYSGQAYGASERGGAKKSKEREGGRIVVIIDCLEIESTPLFSAQRSLSRSSSTVFLNIICGHFHTFFVY